MIRSSTAFTPMLAWQRPGDLKQAAHRTLPNLSARKTFLKGKLAATLQWQNVDLGLLGSNRQRITTFGKDFFTTTNYIQETDIFLLNLSYNLNQTSKKGKLPASEFGEKEF
ncbi:MULTISPECIES: outer membrane beta-barrel protein [Dyadobacter]|uniref:Outer membrane beta-barrel family protein n=1 Tax=Dyadobacter chenhuakuii TaxID=2909339 RepID=A0ABY4XQN1_9BACT|nr:MULTISPECIES: outer membrane beta-barrel protein [Dyadobacter]MCF2492959.1 outer membrane beta-barrel family protein [Dyadobacter chenhuakuii]MCF2517657.1 outer membrane beta-barrel family protein [Dyadobacter sp. CY351]USJ32752.1 outer membrane beta-barrel family protein [Dyadobacter chenhuakuii]